MPENWKRYKLGDISEIIMGQSPKGNTTNRVYRGIPLLNGPTEFGYSHPYPNQFTIDPRKLSKIGDLLFCVRGSTTGKMNFSDQAYAIGRGICVFRGKNGYSSKYVKYLIDYHLENLLSLCTGSTFPNLSKSDLEKFDVYVSEPKESELISSILSTLDDKIELNLQQNKTLEALAMALYKHWFVDFGPFQEGEFVESELGMIPEGWEVKKLREVAKVNSSTIKKVDEFKEILYIDIASVNIGYVDILTKMKLSEAPSRAKRIIKDGDIVVSSVRPNRKARFLAMFFPQNTIVSTGFSVITPVSVPFSFLYPLICMDEFVDYLMSQATGAAYPAVTGKVFENANLVVPTPEVLKKFHAKLENVYFQIAQNNNENQTLTALRESLLPKLISGEVRVKDVEKLISEFK